MLGKFAFAHRTLTAPANRTATANRVNVNAKLPRRGEHRRAKRKAPALAGGCEYDKGILLSHLTVIAQARLSKSQNYDILLQ